MKSLNKKLSFGVLAGLASISFGEFANAAITYKEVTTPAASTGVNGGAYDLYQFFLTGLTNADVTSGTLGANGALLGLSGTFSDSTANGLFVPGVASGTGSWTTYINNVGEQAVPSGFDSSFVNLDSALAPARDGTGTATVTAGKVKAFAGNSTNFNASWGAVSGVAVVPSPALDFSANNLIASIYALPGTTVSFNGAYVTYGTNGGPLTITSGATTTTTTATTHSIISLTTGTTPSYGSADGAIAITGKGNGSYNVTPATGFTTATTGSVLVSGFNPGTDKEIYALKLSKLGAGITDTTVLQSIANDINGQNGNNASSGVSASLITGVFASLFPASQGYDLLLTSTGANPADASGHAVLGFDFSTGGEVNAANSGITVTGVAAVPEPATAAGLVLGAAGLLLGRRKNRLAAA